MPSTENQPTETDLTQEFNAQAETDQAGDVNEAQVRADSVTEGYDEEFNNAAEAQEPQTEHEYSSDAQERADSVADDTDENVSQTEFANAPDLTEEFNDAAAGDTDEAEEDNDDGNDDGNDSNNDPPGPELNYD